MSATDFVDFTHASCPIHADASTTWRVLTTETSALFMGAEFDTDWIVGHPITFEGNWKGTAYRDHGAVVSFDPERLVQFTQFSSMSGKADEAENYDLVTFELSGADNGTLATRLLGTAMTRGRCHKFEATLEGGVTGSSVEVG